MQVIYDGAVYMRNEEWKAFVKKVARFGVRTGIFDCSLDWRSVEGFGKREGYSVCALVKIAIFTDKNS